MPGYSGSYDLNQCFVIVGSYRIEGFGEGDVITIEPRADVGDVTVGADGTSAFYRNNNPVHDVKLILLSTSKGHKNLAAAFDAQNSEDEITRLRFSCEDTLNGDKVVEKNALFKSRPKIVRGAGGVSSAEWSIILPNPTITYGANN